MDNKSESPAFIQNRPQSIDKFEGRSAERVAKAIENHIARINCKDGEHIKLPQIIGLEGAWGSGKSNVIGILKRHVKKEFYIFEYDAWGHQEDLQRRSFLESLTDDLIQAENGTLLPVKCSKKIKNRADESWNEKLDNLLARKRVTLLRTNPRISSGIIGAILIFVFTPITTALANGAGINPWLKIVITLSPLILALIVWAICSGIKRRLILSELFEIFSKEKSESIVNETISENEPNVKEFTEWMHDLSKDLTKKLIIVFDNMDRLPAERVKELWSSIHTFFAECHYSKIWVIIPFDRLHLANAFGKNENGNGDNTHLVNHFINKTFPVVYRVPPPILTDWRKLFSDNFDEAFGHSDNESKEIIQRMFGLVSKGITPRDIIAFINELVAIKLTWLNEDFPLIPMALFVLKKEEILIDPVESILSGNYLKSLSKVINYDEEFQKYISALTYGIDYKLAEQVPLRQYLGRTLKGEVGFNINKYSQQKHFYSILEEEVRNIDPAMLDALIKTLATLNSNQQVDIFKLWNYLVELQLQQQKIKLAFIDTYKELLIHAESDYGKKLVKYLCYNFRDHPDFAGGMFFNAMKELEECITENHLDYVMSDFLKNKQVEPKIFIEYLISAKNEYRKFAVSCDNDTFCAFLISGVPSNLPNMDFLGFLINDKNFDFSGLIDRIETAYEIEEIDIENFPELIKTYKLITRDKPLKKQLKKTQIQSLLVNISDKSSEAYYDLVAMGLVNSINTTSDEGLDVKVSERIEYYCDFGSILILAVELNEDLLCRAAKILIAKPVDHSKMLIEKILPLFENIRAKLGVNEVALLNRLNGWSTYASKSITSDNIDTIIPDTIIFKYAVDTRNSLTCHITQMAIQKLQSLPASFLYSQCNLVDNYWLNCVSLLIKGNILKSLPENLIEYCKSLLLDISSGNQPVPIYGSFNQIILGKADKRYMQPVIKDICLDFCNKRKIITPELFLFFAKEFDFIHKVKSREGDISGIILQSIISDSNCLQLILDNDADYIKIIKKAGDDANDLKLKIRQLMLEQKSEKIRNFANAIGITEVQEIEEPG